MTLLRARDAVESVYGRDLWTPRKYDSLLGWWPAFAQRGTNENLRDLGPLGFDLTFTLGSGSITWERAPLLGNRPALFFNSTSYFTRATDARFTATARTLFVVCVPNETASSKIPFHHGSGDGSESMRLQFVGDTSLYLDPQGGSNYWQTAAGRYAANTAYLITAAVDAGAWSFRRNGVDLDRAAGSGSGASDGTTSPLSISSFGGAASLPGKGWIADVAYYGRRFSAAEIVEFERKIAPFYGISVP